MGLGWDWGAIGMGLRLGWDWDGIGIGLGWNWDGIGMGFLFPSFSSTFPIQPKTPQITIIYQKIMKILGYTM